MTGAIIDTGDPRAVAAVDAIHDGDHTTLRRLLAEHPELATATLGTTGPDGMTRSLLHVATDWPGHHPQVAATIAILVEAGADVHARFTGPHTETPLHWAASSNDVAALDALLAAGADLEAPGAVIAGGTPLDDAVAFAQWRTARRSSNTAPTPACSTPPDSACSTASTTTSPPNPRPSTSTARSGPPATAANKPLPNSSSPTAPTSTDPHPGTESHRWTPPAATTSTTSRTGSPHKAHSPQQT
jgi:hypothetical protein